MDNKKSRKKAFFILLNYLYPFLTRKGILMNLKNKQSKLEEKILLLNKQAEETNKLLAELIMQQNKTEADNKAQMRFFSYVNHELRTPLNAIIGFAQVINSELFGPLNNQQYKEYISFILKSATHLLSIVNDVLDFSKIKEDKLILNETNISLSFILKEIIEVLNQILHENKITIQVYQKEDVVLFADERMIKQIFLNILSNAIKFTKKDGRIDIYIRKSPFGISIVFKDNGIGIGKNKIKKLFQPFYQTENIFSRNNLGTGLGLVLVQKMVILHQGRVSIKSTLHQGTELQIDFPQKRIISLGDKNEVI